MNFWQIFLDVQMKVSVCLQITVDGEVVTDPDMTLG